MNKKKLLTLAMVLSMVAILAIGGTIAYFTDNDMDANVMVMGNVAIKQNEGMRDEDGTIVPFEEQKMIPSTIDPNWNDRINVNGVDYKAQDVGNSVDKIITVTNEGSESAYIRTLLAFEQTDPNEDGDYSDGIASLLHINYNGDDGDIDFSAVLENVKIGDRVYEVLAYTYNEPYAAGETTPPSLLQLWFNKMTTNEDVALLEDGIYTVLALSQAVQSDGFYDYDVDAKAALDTAFGEVTVENVENWFETANYKTSGSDNWESESEPEPEPA